MARQAVNQQYTSMYNTWRKMRDVLLGEEHIKDRSLEQNLAQDNLDGRDELKPLTTFDQYIRPTDSMRRLGVLGKQRFCDYIYRAKFYPFPLEIQHQSLGLIENQPATFDLPPVMEGLIEDATVGNESIEKVLSAINAEQLAVSRVGLLLEPSNEVNKPFNIAMYKTEAIIDWVESIGPDSDKMLTWLKLRTDEVDENNKPIFLILSLENGIYTQYQTINANIKYGDNFAEDDGYIVDSLIVPVAMERPLNEIPFVIINVTRLGGQVERPYLESIADSALSLFRASAHYEDALYWGGESTLFTKGYGLGEDGRMYIGNGASNKTNMEYADAKYVTIGTDGIEPRKANKDAQFEYCLSLGVDLINKGTESGTALNIRTNVKTASLKTLSLTGALGLETVLRAGARWLGADSEAVKVVANTHFADEMYTAEDFSKFASLVSVNAMRWSDMFMLQRKNNLTSAATFEEWKSEIDAQRAENTPEEPTQTDESINNSAQ